MDGVLFDSMPSHAKAWVEVMHRHRLPCTERDIFINEGRTGRDVIDHCYRQTYHTDAPDGLWQQIYKEKSEAFEQKGAPKAVDGVAEVLNYIRQQPDTQIWIVTGSGQDSLFARLESYFPGVFAPERMITAHDVQLGKPRPEPYLKAWQRSGLDKSQCCVIENAPLGIISAKAAGLRCLAVNTGILTNDDLATANPDEIFDDMHQLLDYLRSQTATL